MGYVQNLTRYFRQSLIDADRVCPDDKELLTVLGLDKEAKRHTPYMALAHQAWMSGQMPSEQAGAILAQWQSRATSREEVELAMFPRVDLLRSQGGAGGDNRKRRGALAWGSSYSSTVTVRYGRPARRRGFRGSGWGLTRARRSPSPRS